jgi:hypothetical protein
MKIIAIHSLLFATVLLSYCQSTPKKNTPTLATIVTSKLGKESAIKNNTSNTYALCYELGGGGQHISKRLRFMVVKLSTLQIVAEDFFVLNQISWKNDTQIEYLPTQQSNSSPLETKWMVLTITTAEN